MSLIIRNKTGGLAQLPAVNITADVADGADVDLLAVQPNGLPLNYASDLFRTRELLIEVGAALWAVVSNGVELPPAEGLSALEAAAARNSNQSYANTFYVDPNGSAANTGNDPSQPTTLAAALAAAAFSSNIVLAEGVYTTGAGITVPQDNLTLTARQGGTQSNSVIIQDTITLGPARTRFRAYGVRFDGGFVDNSDGRHYFSACSAGGGTYTRNNPQNFMVWKNCDFAAMPYTATGSGASTLVVEGAATTLSTITNAPTGSLIEIHEATTGRITMSGGGVLVLDNARVQDATLAIDAAAPSVVRAFNSRLTTAAGAPVPITASGTYWLANTVFEPTGSTLGTLAGTPAAFTADIRYTPAAPSDYSPPVVTAFAALDQLAARPAATNFGQQSQVFTEVQPTTISGLGFVPILPASVSPPVNTAPLEQGVYRVRWTAALGPTSGAGRAGAQLLIDFGLGFTPFGPVDSAQAGTGGGAPSTTVGAIVDFVQSNAVPVSLGLRVDAQEYAVGSWANDFTRIEIWRLS